MGIAQIALDPPPSVKQANVEKKVLQTILASPYTPRQMWKKGPQTILVSLYTFLGLSYLVVTTDVFFTFETKNGDRKAICQIFN